MYVPNPKEKIEIFPLPEQLSLQETKIAVLANAN